MPVNLVTDDLPDKGIDFSSLPDQVDPQLRNSLTAAVKKNPDQHTKVRDLSKQSGFPEVVVERNYDEIEQRNKVRTTTNLLKDSPQLSNSFKDPSFAKLAHDDLDNLLKLENSVSRIRGPKPSYISYMEGLHTGALQGLEKIRQGVRLQWADLIGSERMRQDAQRKYDAATTKTERYDPEFETATARGVYGGLTSLTRQAPALAVGIVTKSPVLPLGYMGVQTEAEAYGKYKGRGATPGQAMLGATGEAAVEVATELMPMKFLVDKFGKAGAGEFLTGILAREVPGEQVATLVQDAIDTAVANPDKTWGEYWKERPGAAYETLIATIVQSGIMTGVSAPMSRYGEDINKSQNALDAQEGLNIQVENVKNTKLKTRSPEELKKFLDNVIGAEDEVFLSAEDADIFFQSNQEILKVLPPDVVEMINESMDMGSDIAIQKSDYLTYFSDYHDQLSEVIRNDMDGMNAKEANEWVEQGNEQFEAEAERILAEMEVESEFRTSAENVANNIKSQIMQTGRFTEDAADKYSQLHKSFAVVMADKLNKTPEQVYEKFGLRVTGAPITREQAIEALYQAEPEKTPTDEEIDEFIAQSRERHRAEEERFLERGKAIEAGEILYQEAKGQIQFVDDGSIITLLQDADLSSFLHESAHFFFEAYKTFAAESPEIAKDMQTLLDFIEVENLETWNSMTLEQRREGHEKVARAFEAYLFEGKAPNLEIQSLFQRFRDWLLNVYQNLTALNVELTDEVRQVFDRMLATKEQIREKEVARAYEPLFESAEEAGMTEKQWQEYQSTNERRRVMAESELQTRSLRDMKWLSRAKGKALRALQRDAKDRRKAVTAEISEKVSRETVYQAITFLKTGEFIDAEGNVIKTADAHKLDREEFTLRYPDEPLPKGLTESNGLPLDIVGEMFGFTSGDEMIQAILDAEPKKERIERLTNQRMLEKYGDLNSPEAIERAAEQAIHNDAHTRFLHTELTNLTKRTGTGNVLSRAAKLFAEQAISRKKVKDIRPSQYSSAETRAAKNTEKALINGDRDSAAEHKRAQVLNNHFFRAANNAQNEIEKMLRYFKKFDNAATRKNLDPDYRDQIDAILERYDLRKGVSQKEIERRKSLSAWIEAQEEQGLSPIIDERLLGDIKKQHYKDTPFEEMVGLRDSIKNIEHLARLKNKLLKAKAKRELDAAATEISGSIREYSTGKNKVKIESNSWTDRARKVKDEFFAMHRKFASIARQMDGFKDGPMWEYFIRPMNEAGDFEAVEREKATMALHELFKPIIKEGKLREKKFIPQINNSLSKEGRIAIALNWGNESNRQRVMDGEGWSQNQVQSILDTLTKQEWDFVQGVWDYVDSYWPQISEKERRVSGVVPEKVEAVTVKTKHGEYKGGYYPIKYDPERSTRAEQDTLAEITKQAMNGLYTRATTRRGHTKARAERVSRPIRKDFGVIFEHVDQVIHDLAWHEWLIDTNRLLRTNQVDDAIRTQYGPEVLKAIRKAVDDIAAGDVPAQNAFEKSINHLRTGVSIAGMGWNLWTSLLQPLGLTQSMVRVGPKWIARGMSEWFGSAVKMENAVARIYEKSDFMRLRGKTLQREINEIRNKVSDGGKLPAVTDSFFYLIMKAQMVADVPTWLGAYEKAVYEGNNEDRAVALANQAVLDSQGGGQIKDLAQIQRGSPLLKLWTNFYSYFNTTLNLTAESYRRTDFRDPSKVGRLAVDMMLLYTVPATLSAIMREFLKGKCDGDEECIVEEITRENLSYMLGTMVGVREMSSFVGGYYGYSGPAGTRFFSEASKLGRQIEQGEADAAMWKALNNTSGVVFHYPAGQVQRTIEGIIAIEEGNVEGPGVIAAPLFGPPK